MDQDTLPFSSVIYPDGSTKSRPPDQDTYFRSDGAVFTWDDILGCWVDSRGDIWKPEPSLSLTATSLTRVSPASKANGCECGSWVVGGDRHSSWCSLYKKQ